MSDSEPMENLEQEESTLENEHQDPEPRHHPSLVQQGPPLNAGISGIFNISQDFPSLGNARPSLGLDTLVFVSDLNSAPTLHEINVRFNELLVLPVPVPLSSAEFESTTTSLNILKYSNNMKFVKTIIELTKFAKRREHDWSIEFLSPSPLKKSLVEFIELIEQLVHNCAKFPYYVLPTEYYDLLEALQDMDVDVHDGILLIPGTGVPLPAPVRSRLNQFLEFHLELEAKKVFPTRLETTGVPEPIFLNTNQVKIKDKIIETLTCPVCYTICFPPFSYCENLHFLCFNCTEVLIRRPLYRSLTYTFPHQPNCPTCKSEVVGLKANWMEGVHEELQFRCGFPGCDFVANGLKIKRHMDYSCHWRTWKCHFCTTILCSSNFNFHMIRAHDLVLSLQDQDIVNMTFHGAGTVKAYGYENGTFKFPIKRTGQMTTYKLYQLKYTYGAIRFILYQFESPLAEENSKFMWIPCILGSEEEAAKYEMKFSIEFQYQSKSSKFPKYTACLKTKDPITVRVASIKKDIRQLIIEYGLIYDKDQVPNDIYKMKMWIPSPTVLGNLNVEVVKRVEDC